MKKLLFIVFLFFSAVSTMLAQRTITGTVTDVDDVPLIGANVIVQGTSVGTITDIDGSFSLNVEDDATVLVISYTGFTDAVVDITSTNSINVRLIQGQFLDEVVVTAMGLSKEKKSLGYATTELAGEAFERKPEADIGRLLKGQVAGVNITSTSGVSGSGTNIVIRGYSSITGSNQPLFVVDGVPFNTSTNGSGVGNNSFLEGGQAGSSRFLDLDPSNIESISVLKGLAATVIYGEQGKNGVILVSTKSGSNTSKFEVSLDQSYYVTSIASLPQYQNNYGGGFHQNFGFFFSNWGPNFDTRGQRGIDANGQVNHPLSALTDPSLKAQFAEFDGARYDYRPYQSQEDFFEDGHVSTTSLNLGGGNDKVNYSATLSYTDDVGFVPNNNLERMNFGLGGSVKLTDKLTMRSTFNFAKTEVNTPPISYGDGSGIFAGGGISIFSDVFYVPRNVDLGGLPYIAQDNRPVYYRSGNDILNPRWTAENAKNTSNVDRIFGQNTFSYTLTDNISLNYRFGFDRYNEKQEYIVNRIDLASADYSTFNTGYYRTLDIESRIWDQNVYANLDFPKIFGDDFDLTGTVGFNSRIDEFERNGIESTNQLVFGFIEHSNFTNNSARNSVSGVDLQTRAKEVLMAAYGTFTLDYQDFVYLNVAARNDWTSTVEPENRALFYPSVSLSVIPTEKWIQPNDFLSFLKFRVAYGTSAGFPPPYATRSVLSVNPRIFISNTGNVLTTNGNATYFEDNGAGSTLGNPNLTPELHKEAELGVEAKFFKNRVGLDLSVYNKNTNDLITQTPIDPSTGFTSTSINVGNINNKGLELGLNVTPFSKNDFSWNVGVNFFTYRTEVTELTEDLDEVSIEGFTNLGNFAQEGEVFGIMKGTLIARDEDGNPIIDGDGYYTPTDTIGIIGNPHPDFTLGLNNTLSYKNFTLSAQFEYRKGGDVYSGSARALLARGLTEDTDFDRTQAFVLDGVKEDGTPNTTMITATNLYFDNFGFGPSEVSVFDGTTLRLRDISLSYTLPQSVCDKLNVSGLTVGLSGQNLWYKAVNLPEHSNVDTDALGFAADGNGLGFEFLNGPSVRRIGGNIQLKF